MERLPPFYEEEEDDDDEHHLHHHQQQEQHGMLSCWGKLKQVFPWRRLRRHVRRRNRVPVKRGSFKYDPLSYSQNFDDGGKDEDEENLPRGFSSRFVALNASTSIKQGGGG